MGRMKAIQFCVVIFSGWAVAAPSTRPVEDHRRASADGVEFPDVAYLGKVRQAPAKYSKISNVVGLLLQRPEDVNLRIFNAAKSQEMFRNRSTWRVQTDTSSTRNRSTETVSGVTVGSGGVDTEWFAINVAGSDIAGLDLEDGVISRVVLFYRRQQAGAKMLNGDRRPGWRGAWKIDTVGPGLRIELKATEALKYLIANPDLSPEITDAIGLGKLVRGMSIEEAELSLGVPYSTTDSGTVKTMVWHPDDGIFWRATFVDGKATTVGHDDLR